MHDPKKIVILELCFLFNSVDASMNMIILKVCVSAGSESVGSRLMWGDEVLASHKYTMSKKVFLLFLHERQPECMSLLFSAQDSKPLVSV